MENYDNKTPDNRTVRQGNDDRSGSYIMAAVAVVVVLGAVFFVNRSGSDYNYRTATQMTAPATPANMAPNTTHRAP